MLSQILISSTRLMTCSNLSWLLPLALRSIRQCPSCTPFISVPTVVALDTTAVVTTTTCRHTNNTSTHFIAPSASRCTLRLCMVLCHISLDHDVLSCWCRCVATAVRAKTCAAAVFGSASSSFDTSRPVPKKVKNEPREFFLLRFF